LARPRKANHGQSPKINTQHSKTQSQSKDTDTTSQTAAATHTYQRPLVSGR